MRNHIELIYPELSYKIVGCAFNAHNELGENQSERTYQRALAEEFKANKFTFKEQVYFPVAFRDKIVGKNFIDFVVENKIVVEIKKGDRYSKRHIEQVLRYLKASDLKLAILINFGREGVSFKRIINLNS